MANVKNVMKNKDRIQYLEKWIEKYNSEDLLTDNVSLHSVSEIRGKMTPFANLIAILENGVPHKSDRHHRVYLKEIDNCKKVINELCEREKYSR